MGGKMFKAIKMQQILTTISQIPFSFAVQPVIYPTVIFVSLLDSFNA